MFQVWSEGPAPGPASPQPCKRQASQLLGLTVLTWVLSDYFLLVAVLLWKSQLTQLPASTHPRSIPPNPSEPPRDKRSQETKLLLLPSVGEICSNRHIFAPSFPHKSNWGPKPPTFISHVFKNFISTLPNPSLPWSPTCVPYLFTLTGSLRDPGLREKRKGWK